MITFRPLEPNDFDLLNKWMNIDFVSKWYDRRKNIYDDVERKYYSDNKTSTFVRSFIIMYEYTPIGYIQSYRIQDYPEYARCLLVSTGTIGLDMFIGDLDYVGKGLGKEIVIQYVNRQVFREKDITSCIAGPEPNNKPAIRVYEKAGFKYLKTVYCGENNQPEYIMMLSKYLNNNGAEDED